MEVFRFPSLSARFSRITGSSPKTKNKLFSAQKPVASKSIVLLAHVPKQDTLLVAKPHKRMTTRRSSSTHFLPLGGICADLNTTIYTETRITLLSATVTGMLFNALKTGYLCNTIFYRSSLSLLPFFSYPLISMPTLVLTLASLSAALNPNTNSVTRCQHISSFTNLTQLQEHESQIKHI